MIKPKRYKYYLALSDLVILTLSAFFSIYFIEKGAKGVLFTAESSTGIAVMPFIIAGAFYLFIFESNKLYAPNIILKKSAHFNAVVKAVLYVSVGLILFSLVLQSSSIIEAAMFIGTFTVITFVLLYLYRVQIVTPMYLNNDDLNKNVLIVGDGLKGKELITSINAAGKNGLNIIGSVNLSVSKSSNGYLGSLKDLPALVKKYKVNELVVACDTDNPNELFRIIDECKNQNVKVKVCSPLFDVVIKKIKCDTYGSVPVVNLSKENSFYVQSGLKRALDIAGSLIGLIILSPLFLIVSVLIKLTSPGPVFFKQMRIGKDGRLFEFYKFRSMYQFAGEDEERALVMKQFLKKNKLESGEAKVVNLSRVTKIGRILRKTSIDELPQLYNVLKGDMSLVGARPDVPYVYDMYEEWHKRRVKCVPGCTGVWQVTGRSDVTFNEMTILDIYYLYNISLLLDLKMILLTIPVMLFARGGK